VSWSDSDTAEHECTSEAHLEKDWSQSIPKLQYLTVQPKAKITEIRSIGHNDSHGDMVLHLCSELATAYFDRV